MMMLMAVIMMFLQYLGLQVTDRSNLNEAQAEKKGRLWV